MNNRKELLEILENFKKYSAKTNTGCNCILIKFYDKIIVFCKSCEDAFVFDGNDIDKYKIIKEYKGKVI